MSAAVPRVGGRATGWWGMVWALLVLGMMLGTLLFAHVYLAARQDVLPPPGLTLPAFPWAATVLALAGVLPAALAHRAVGGRGQAGLQVAAGIALLLGAGFLGAVWVHLRGLPFAPDEHAFASSFTLAIAFHGICAAVGVVQWMYLQLHVWSDPLPGRVQVLAVNAALYWYYVAAGWAGVVVTLHAVPGLW